MVRMYSGVAESGAAVDAPAAAKDAQSNDAQSNSATGTNVQEVGVDEPDYVKTNGSLLVRIVGSNRLVVTDVSGARPIELGRVDFPDDMYGGEMLLVGDRVVVSGGTNASAQSGGPTDGPIPRDMMGTLVPFHYQGAESRILTISISDPRHPTVVSDRRIDGSILTMRQYGDNVRVVLTSSYPDLDFIYPSKKVTEKQALAHNQQAVRDSAISDWLPAIRQSAKDPGTPASGPSPWPHSPPPTSTTCAASRSPPEASSSTPRPTASTWPPPRGAGRCRWASPCPTWVSLRLRTQPRAARTAPRATP
jgi:hypothetical protein